MSYFIFQYKVYSVFNVLDMPQMNQTLTVEYALEILAMRLFIRIVRTLTQIDVQHLLTPTLGMKLWLLSPGNVYKLKKYMPIQTQFAISFSMSMIIFIAIVYSFVSFLLWFPFGLDYSFLMQICGNSIHIITDAAVSFCDWGKNAVMIDTCSTLLSFVIYCRKCSQEPYTEGCDIIFSKLGYTHAICACAGDNCNTARTETATGIITVMALITHYVILP